MKRCKLGELLTIKHGYAFKSENYVGKSKYALVTLANISLTNNFQCNQDKLTYYGAEFPIEFILEEGDMIMPLTEQVRGLFGNTAFVPYIEDIVFVLNQRVGKVVPKEGKADKYYLHYLLATEGVREQLEYRASGTRQRNISPSDVYDVEVFVPSYQIQKSIGKTLYRLEEKVNINNKINAELESMAKTIYDYWFLQFEFPNEEGKPYKSSGGKMVWNEELKREIPAGWKNGNFSDLIEIGNGRDHKELHDGKIPVYGSGGVMRLVDTSIYDGESVLIPRKGTLNNVIYVNGAFWTVDTMFYSKMKMKHIAIFTYYSARLYDFEKLNTGTGVPSMTSSIIYNLKTVIPTKQVLKDFDEIVQSLYRQIHKNNIENRELMSLRDFLLPLLMNGQIGFKD